MSIRSTIPIAALLSIIAVQGTIAAASPAQALSSSVQACPEIGQTSYVVSPAPVYIGDRATRTYGRAGGTITLSLGESVTTGGSISGSTTVEANAIFAKASVSVGLTIKKDWTSSITRAYAWTVPQTQSSGWVEAGHRGYSVAFTQSKIVYPCTVANKTGRIVGNTANIEFMHS